MSETASDLEVAVGEWWEPIASAPKDGSRIMLAFPAVNRERKLGEPKPKGMRNAQRKAFGEGRIIRPPNVTIGLWVAGSWAPGRRAPLPFFDEPTHWMYLPDLPDELAEHLRHGDSDEKAA